MAQAAAPYSAGNNMVFSGVANGEALWGHPQMVSAESPENFGGSEWSANLAMHGQHGTTQQAQQQAQQPLQQQPSPAQHQQQQPPPPQQQHIHQYPFTTTAGHGQYQEQETNLLDGISWVCNL